ARYICSAGPKSRMEDPTYYEDLAYHEAGDAVIGRVLRLACGYASIKPHGDWDGSAKIHDPWTTVTDWGLDVAADPVRFRRKLRAAFRGTIVAVMAGEEAERELYGLPFDYDGARDDRDDIEALAASSEAELPNDVWARYEPRMRRQTRRLVRRYS